MIKEQEYYKMTFKFNASHSMSDRSNEHAHTFMVSMYIRRLSNNFIEFYEYETAIANYIQQYKGAYLNDIFDFNPTLEALCLRFFDDISYIFNKDANFELLSLELGDNPTKTVKVGKEIIINQANIKISEFHFDLCQKGLGL